MVLLDIVNGALGFLGYCARFLIVVLSVLARGSSGHGSLGYRACSPSLFGSSSSLHWFLSSPGLPGSFAVVQLTQLVHLFNMQS